MSNEAIDALLAEASRLYNEGHYRRAIQKWQEVLAADPANQKATESIRIASLLSDTWTDQEETAPAAGAAESAPSPETQQLEDGLAGVKEMLAARRFQEALQQCETLSGLAPASPEIKSLADQARSGLEAEPFIRAALTRAEKELKAGNFDTVELLCRKVISLDAGNRRARTFLYMAQRRTAGEPEAAAEEGSVAESAPAESPSEDPALSIPPEAGEEIASDPLTALGGDLGDFSPMDLAGAEAAPEAAAAAPETEPPPEAQAGATAAISAFERGEEVDASQIESIPLVQTRKAGDLVREASIYAPTEEETPQETAVPESRAPAAAGPVAISVAEDAETPPSGEPALPDMDLSDLSAPGPAHGAAAAPPATAPSAPASAPRPAARAGVDHSDTKPQAAAGGKTATDRPARPMRAPAAAVRPATAPRAAARAGGGHWIMIAALLMLMVGGLAGAAFWWINRPMKMEPLSIPPLPKPSKPAVTPVSGPGGESTAGAAAQSPTPGAAPHTADSATTGETPAPGREPQAAAAAEPQDAPQGDDPAPAPAAQRPSLPTDPAAREAMARRKFPEAKRLAVAGDLAGAREILLAVLELDPVMFEARDLMDEVEKQIAEERRFDTDVQTVIQAFESGDYRSALWKMYRLQESFPETRVWDRNIAAAWYNWGVLLLKAGNPREAADKFNEALGIDSQDREATRQLAVAERYRVRPKDQAFFAYVEALNMRPLVPMRRP
jgi:tetratricopeptide (TPR) repeat protein